MKLAVILLVALALPLLAIGATHGPLFGLATPTNSQGEWSFDEEYSAETRRLVLKLHFGNN